MPQTQKIQTSSTDKKGTPGIMFGFFTKDNKFIATGYFNVNGDPIFSNKYLQPKTTEENVC